MAEKFIDYEQLKYRKGAICVNQLGVKLSKLAGLQVTPNLLTITSKFPKNVIEETIELVIAENDVPNEVRDYVRQYLVDRSLYLVEQ